MEGPTLAGAGTQAAPLALEGKREAESYGWHQFFSAARARSICVRVEK